MTVETTQPSGEAAATDSTEPVANGTTEATPQTTRTAEEVEAEWKYRVSQKDKAHEAEARALREENARLKESDDQKRRAEDEARQANMTAEQRAQDHINTLNRQLEEKDRQHLIELRKIKFPTVAAELDEAVLAVTDEAKLAGLEAKLIGAGAVPPSATSLIDPNSVARQNGTQPTSHEQTVDELKAELQRQGPAFVEELRQSGVRTG